MKSPHIFLGIVIVLIIALSADLIFNFESKVDDLGKSIDNTLPSMADIDKFVGDTDTPPVIDVPSKNYEPPKDTLFKIKNLREELDIAERGVSLQKSYNLINVQVSPFDRSDGQFTAEEADYLERVFTATDILVIERTQNQLDIQTGEKPHLRNYDKVIKYLGRMEPPSGLENFHDLLLKAVVDQKKYFAEMTSSKQQFDASHALVGTSHNNLLEAYSILMAKYKSNLSNSHGAFYSHLCALDFI